MLITLRLNKNYYLDGDQLMTTALCVDYFAWAVPILKKEQQ